VSPRKNQHEAQRSGFVLERRSYEASEEPSLRGRNEVQFARMKELGVSCYEKRL